MTIREQSGCSTICVPIQYSSFVNSAELPTCKRLDEHLCAHGQIFHYINHQTTKICNSMNSNSKKYYKGLHYFRSELGVDRNSFSLQKNVTKGKKVLRIEWKFASNIRMIREEKLVYEGKYLFAWLGGSLSIFIGLSFFDICSQIIDLAIYIIQKQGTNDKKMTSLNRNIEEGNHKLTPIKDKIPCPNCNTLIFTNVRSVRKISQCSVELNCLEEPKAVANEILGPENFCMQFHDKFARVNHPMKAYSISPKTSSMEQITGSKHSLYPNSPTLTLSQGYSPKQPHLRRKSSPILTQPQVYSPKLPQSRRHSVDVLEKGGFSKIPRHLRRQSMGNIQENV